LLRVQLRQFVEIVEGLVVDLPELGAARLAPLRPDLGIELVDLLEVLDGLPRLILEILQLLLQVEDALPGLVERVAEDVAIRPSELRFEGFELVAGLFDLLLKLLQALLLRVDRLLLGGCQDIVLVGEDLERGRRRLAVLGVEIELLLDGRLDLCALLLRDLAVLLDGLDREEELRGRLGLRRRVALDRGDELLLDLDALLDRLARGFEALVDLAPSLPICANRRRNSSSSGFIFSPRAFLAKKISFFRRSISARVD
jgi:hypothetical protein